LYLLDEDGHMVSYDYLYSQPDKFYPWECHWVSMGFVRQDYIDWT